MILITTDDISNIENKLNHNCCGAYLTFKGVVRNHHKGRAVDHIVYECYQTMAYKEFKTIISEATKKWDVHNCHLFHRIGKLLVGEVSLVIHINSPHRAESFEAMQYIINQLKKRVPIWKKEGYINGKSEWIFCEGCAA